ncbi:MAG: DUF2281 domain-containing protein [Caldilineaceae bacterium]
MHEIQIQYVADSNGNLTSVLVPIELWREIEAELDAAYLLHNESIKKRLLEAIQNQKPQRPFGSAQGQIIIMPDFDEPLEELQDYM